MRIARSIRGSLQLVALLACIAGTLPASAGGLDPATEIEPFLREQQAAGGFDAARARQVLAGARVLPEVIARMTRPAEALPWYRYRRIFLTADRIESGRRFVAEHEAEFAAAERRFGVDRRVIAAIIGVESFYGRHRGRLRVLDALATLAFRYDRRARFFRGELGDFLRLVDEEGIDPTTALGSYAGAMGLPQFIPSSYRHYAVDFDGDGRRDLYGSVADAIGSVASYLAQHGWQRGRTVAFPVHVEGDGYHRLLDAGIEPSLPVSGLAGLGIAPVAPGVAPDELAALVEVEAEQGREFWVALKNFYVITRYNHSPLYALAVHQLADELAGER